MHFPKLKYELLILLLARLKELTPLKDIHFSFLFSRKSTNRDKIQNIFYLIDELCGFIKYTLNKPD